MPDELAHLHQLVDEMVGLATATGFDEFFAPNAAFHAHLRPGVAERDAAGARMSQLIGQMGRYQMRSVALRGTLRRSTVEHKAILRAVRAGDADRGRAAAAASTSASRSAASRPRTDEEVVVRNAS